MKDTDRDHLSMVARNLERLAKAIEDTLRPDAPPDVEPGVIRVTGQTPKGLRGDARRLRKLARS